MMRNAYRILVGKPEGKRPHRRPRRRWGDNIRMDIKEIRREVLDWFHLAQGKTQWRALVDTIMRFQVQERWEIC